jgi:superfamily II DNA or RNA helicase
MSSEKRKKNNEARMKVYSKNKEKEGWNQYEHHIVEHHYTKHKHTVWHWSFIPEEHLYNAGYINDYNKHRLERLAKFKEGTNRHKDYGLDGLSMDLENTYHGLQAKYYLTNKVSANDIGTFQSVTRRLNKKNPLSKGYLYTSTNLEPTLAEDIECIGDIIHEKVLFEPEDKRTTRHQKKIIKETDLPLRQYQKDALESLKEEREGLGTLSLFCGGGKTLIAGHYLSTLKPKIIVMIAPLKISVDNLCQRMECFFDGYEHLVIDSDSGNTTDADVAKEKLEQDKPIVLYTTFASAVNVLSEIFAEKEELFEDSFCLVDECHNIVNNTELCEFISRFYDGLLMSATIPEELYEVIDCEPVYEYGMAEAIKEGYCVDYNVWLPLVVKKEETNAIEIDVPEDFEKSDLCAKVLFLVNGMLQTGSKRCIVYLRNIDECAAFNELFTKVCKEYHGLSSWTETIDCNVKQEKRRTILEDFQSEKEDLTTLHILTSVRILDEAVDVVRCDSEFITYVGVNADDKRAVQRLQRGGRLDSMNLSKKNNLFIWCSEYASMLSMLSLLKESDPEFHTKLRILNGSYDAGGKKESVEKSAVQLGDLQKYVEVRCLSDDEVWEQKRLILINYIKINNIYPRSTSTNTDEKKIGLWVKNQRRNYVKKGLSNKRIELLNTINGWLWKTERKSFDYYYNKLKGFYELYKRLPCKGTNKTSIDYELGWWASRIRSKYKKTKLEKEYIELLNKLDFWKWILPKKTFEENLKLYLNFVNANHKEPTTSSKNINEKQIGTWASQQRSKNNNNTINQSYKKILNSTAGWKWELDDFDEKFNNIKEFCNINNKLPTQHSKNENEKKLGRYIQNMRKSYKNNTMSDERKKSLNSLTNWSWDDSKNTFNDNYKLWEQFINDNRRHPLARSEDSNEKFISDWVSRIRYYYKNESTILKKEHIEILNNNSNWVWKVRDRT